jgi:hypothetical protein
MGQPVVFISRFRIRDGQYDAYKQLAAEVTPQLKEAKPETVVFLSYVGEGNTLTIIHAFPNAESMDRHIEGSDERSQAAMPLLIPLGWEIYGMPSKAALATMERAAAAASVVLTVLPEFVSGFLRPSADT